MYLNDRLNNSVYFHSINGVCKTRVVFKIWSKIAFIGAFLVLLISAYSLCKIKAVSAAYLYGYPLLMMEQSRLTSQSNLETPSFINRFNHIQEFPNHEFRNVVRPNNDTLYSNAWIDLSIEPLVLSVPDTENRYYVMPFMDAWTNVFAMVGKRTTGTSKGTYLVVGPDWSGALPDGMLKLASPTNIVWLIGRIQTNGEDDIANVVALQKKFSLTSLSKWRRGQRGEEIVSRKRNLTQSPMSIVESYSPSNYFSRLSSLMYEQASSSADGAALENLKKLGIVPGKKFERLNMFDQLLFEKAFSLTQQRMVERLNSVPSDENGWSVHRSIIGDYGKNYAFRAGVAKVGLGALPPQEAVYPSTKVDALGQRLSGDGRYKIHFKKGDAPPVNAFWSLSIYNDEGFFIENKINRYAIGDRDALNYNADGSLDILIQVDEPKNAKGNNWLPAPSGYFSLTMRLYSPKQRFISGGWKLPKVERVR